MSDDTPKTITVPKRSDFAAMIAESDASDFLLGLVNLSDSGVFHDPDCPICNSSHRRKAEADWLKTRDADMVRQLFKDHGETYSIPYIKNHMEEHLDSSQREIRKREYIEKVLSASRRGLTTLETLDIAIAALHNRLAEIEALENSDPAKSPVEVAKIKADSVKNLTAAMGNLCQLRAKMLGELKRDGEVFTIKKGDFAKISTELFNEAENNDQKLMISKFMEKIVEIAVDF